MLFDLSNPRRKNVVRVVYGLLAVVFGGGFIFFGIGSETGGGGLFDGLFGEGGNSTASQYEQQIEDAEEKLEADPDNARALADLTQYRFSSAQAQFEYDESTGQVTGVPEEARGELEAAAEAWNRYLDTDPPKVDVTAATSAVNAFTFLEDASGAAEAQELLAKANPSANAYVALARFRYADLDLKGARKAGEQALESSKPAQRKQVKKLLDQYDTQAVRFQKQLAKQPDAAAGGGSELENPFGSLSPEGGGAVPPSAP